MFEIKHRKSFFRIGYVVIFSAFLFSSCVYDQQIRYQNNQIADINKRIKSLENNLHETRKSFASTGADVDQLKQTLAELTGRIEDIELIIKHAADRDLMNQDYIRDELKSLDSLTKTLKIIVRRQDEYLGLKSFAILEEEKRKQQEAQQASETPPKTDPENKPATEAKPEKPKKITELELYDQSLALYREGKPEQATDGFKLLLKKYPKSDRADNAQFWIGECLMSLKQYEQAILAYQNVIKKYPKGNKVSNSMLRQAVAFKEINDKTSARLLLKKLIKKYPTSNEAKIAKTMLNKIK